METLEFISNALPYISTSVMLTGFLAFTSSVLVIPMTTAVGYASGRKHEFGFKDGKSAVKCIWKVANNVDIRDLSKRRLSEEEFNKKYEYLGLEKYFLTN